MSGNFAQQGEAEEIAVVTWVHKKHLVHMSSEYNIWKGKIKEITFLIWSKGSIVYLQINNRTLDGWFLNCDQYC